MNIRQILKTHRHFLSITGIILSVVVAAQAQTTPRSLQIPLSVTPLNVQMDGTLNDPSWQQSAVADNFVMDQTSAPATPQTTARVMADSDYLYVGMTVQEPNISKLVHNGTARQGSLWNDDCVEIFLDPTHSGAWMYHWIVNPNGALWEGLGASAGGTPSFTSGATSVAKIDSDLWTCELKIPWKDLMVKPQSGQWLGMNFTRERKAGGGNQLSAWSPTMGNFSDPQILTPVLLGSANKLQILSLGSGSAEFNQGSTNQFIAQIPSNQLPVKAQIFAKGKMIANGRADTSSHLKVPYTVSTAAPLIFKISQGAKVLFIATLNAPVPTPRVWQVPDPLYKSLLSEGPPGSSKDGVLVWGFNLSNQNILRQTARRFGIDYSLEKMHQQAGQYKMRIFGLPVWFKEPANLNPTQSAAWKKADVKFAYMLRGVDPWIIDPKVIDSSLEQLDKILTTDGSSIWAVTASDETDNTARYQGADLMENPPKDYPFLQQADNEVRTQFGGGKWGIPHGRTDTNPYRWIAFNKWLNVQIHNRTMRMRAIVAKHHLNIPIVSFDPVSNPSGNNYSEIASDYDIFTHQVFPLPNQWRPRNGFFTKFLADLTGKDVWPCVHVENYGFATTPQETREMLSEVFRNGGTGFHFYWQDVQGGKKLIGDTRMTPFGSPRRYNTILNTIKLTQTMPKVRLPQNPRTAILYNDDMLQSLATSNLSVGGPGDSTEACYTFLGPVARSWFKFIDDSKVLSSPSLNQQFDTIYIPSATYQRPEIVAKLRAFVQNGGTIVCADANAFSTDTLGNDTSAQRQEIFGVQTDGNISPKVLSVKVDGKSFSLPMSNGAVKLNPTAGTRVLGTFDDGSPAITSHTLGRGQAILFATNPFHFNLLPDSQWRDFFTAWATHLKDPVGLDIWRFQFPDSVLGKDLPTPPGVCLTNNHVAWQEEKPVILGNLDVSGKYQVQPAPDAMPDSDGIATADAQNWISFADGHLTDRRQSMLDPKIKPESNATYKNPDSRWMDSWKSTSAVTLTYDLQKPVKLNAVKFWFDDTMPTFTVQGSNDLHHWTQIGENKTATNAGVEVLDVTTSLHATAPCRYVRVIFAPRESGQKLTLVESEVWGNP